MFLRSRNCLRMVSFYDSGSYENIPELVFDFSSNLEFKE